MKAILISPRAGAAMAGTLAAIAVLSACGSAGTASPGSSGRVEVVAAENFWGSIVTQVGGDHAHVTSVISNPNTDPHSYEPTPQDGRALAQAQYVVVNGAGYDPWAPKLVDANPSSTRRVLTIADLAGRKEGDNPHMWYSPSIVTRVIDRVAADLSAADPTDAAYFSQQATNVKTVKLQQYNQLRTAIAQQYADVKVGATESIFEDLAADLKLDLTTPPGYMRAISEGTDPTADDKATFDRQVGEHTIQVLVFNRQNSTPDIQALVDTATAKGIPVVPITETLDPATAGFQDWQAAQLAALQAALAKATGR
jgi:zinc/manganese transport system substrate-binding protein